MTHDQLVAAVLALAARNGVLAHYCQRSARCQGRRGLPDVFLAGPGGAAFAEVKAGDDDTTAEQDLWRWVIERTMPGAWHLWREDDWDAGRVLAVITGLAQGA